MGGMFGGSDSEGGGGRERPERPTPLGEDGKPLNGRDIERQMGPYFGFVSQSRGLERTRFNPTPAQIDQWNSQWKPKTPPASGGAAGTILGGGV